MTSQPRLIHVSITFRNLDSTPAIKQAVEEKIANCVQKFVHHDTEVHVILLLEKGRHIAEASFRADGADFFAKEESDSMYSSIDKVVASLSQQLRKHKEKLTDHHVHA